MILSHLPGWVPVVFAIAFAGTLLMFFRLLWDVVPSRRKLIAIGIAGAAWIALQAAFGLHGVYSGHLDRLPPQLLVFGLLPALLTIAGVFATRSGRAMVDRISLRRLTLLHTIRIPVEIALFGLYLGGAVPRLMTFEGGNLDIFSGLSAPLIGYLAFSKEGNVRRRLLLGWNVVCLALLGNIVVRALGSTPFPFQRFAFEQPNVAILHFPFMWLPTVIVPIVLFSHLAAFRQLLRQTR